MPHDPPCQPDTHAHFAPQFAVPTMHAALSIVAPVYVASAGEAMRGGLAPHAGLLTTYLRFKRATEPRFLGAALDALGHMVFRLGRPQLKGV